MRTWKASKINSRSKKKKIQKYCFFLFVKNNKVDSLKEKTDIIIDKIT